MQRINLNVSPEVGFDLSNLAQHLKKQGHLEGGQHFRIERRSVDARQKNIRVNLSISINADPLSVDFVEYHPADRDVSKAPEVIVVGAGPAGLFAALRAIEEGLKPVVLERGKDVRTRRRDLAAINKEHIVNPESNYCFGEGGAGTYSDGKLYTRSNKRGSIRKVFEILVAHGATEEILYEAHPHIGTNKLPKIVTALRETILASGGEVYFDTRVDDFIMSGREIQGVVTQDGTRFTGIGVVLATGHSARDIFTLCRRKGIRIEAKSFALGVRVEHRQELIDTIQYHGQDRGNYLPAASYSLVAQAGYQQVERGVFSFCMCPGGFIVPAATAPGEVVVNGMSPSRRDSRYANSGIVVAVEPKDIRAYEKYGPLAALQFQQSVEQKAWELGGKRQTAPAQRLGDFVDKKASPLLLPTSYQPGLLSADMWAVLPGFISERLRQGFVAFGKKMKGYLTNDAQIIGVESRTSSPVRIPRNPDTCEHVEVRRLYPCAEGAGYAGGIVSAAMDGDRCMGQLAGMYRTKGAARRVVRSS